MIATLFGSLSTIPFVGVFAERVGLKWLGLVMDLVSSALGPMPAGTFVYVIVRIER